MTYLSSAIDVLRISDEKFEEYIANKITEAADTGADKVKIKSKTHLEGEYDERLYKQFSQLVIYIQQLDKSVEDVIDIGKSDLPDDNNFSFLFDRMICDYNYHIYYDKRTEEMVIDWSNPLG